MMGINWYLCEATRAGHPLPNGTTNGEKVYCKRAYFSQDPKRGADKRASGNGYLVIVLRIGRDMDQCSKFSPYVAKKHLKIIRRLNDAQSKKLDLLYLDAEYLSKSIRSAKLRSVKQ